MALHGAWVGVQCVIVVFPDVFELSIQRDIYTIDNQYSVLYYRPPDKNAYQKIFFLFLSKNMCCGYSKEPPR